MWKDQHLIIHGKLKAWLAQVCFSMTSCRHWLTPDGQNICRDGIGEQDSHGRFGCRKSYFLCREVEGREKYRGCWLSDKRKGAALVGQFKPGTTLCSKGWFWSFRASKFSELAFSEGGDTSRQICRNSWNCFTLLLHCVHEGCNLRLVQ